MSINVRFGAIQQFRNSPFREPQSSVKSSSAALAPSTKLFLVGDLAGEVIAVRVLAIEIRQVGLARGSRLPRWSVNGLSAKLSASNTGVAGLVPH